MKKRIGLSYKYIFLFSLLVIFILHMTAYWGFLVEDAFISFRYAENFADGLGLVFNAGEYVEGYTNFLWVLLLGVFNTLGFDTIVAAKVLGAVAGITTIFTTYKMSFAWYEDGKLDYFRFVAPLLLSIYTGFVLWTLSGLETMLFTLFVTLSFYVFITWSNQDSLLFGLLFALLTGLASLTRPEGPLFFFIGVTILFGRNILKRRNLIKSLKMLLGPLVVFCIIFGSYLIWRYVYYGYPLPNTFYLKVDLDGRSAISQGFWYISGFWESIGGWWLFWAPLVLFVTRWKQVWLWYAWGTVVAWLFYVRQVNGDWMTHYRFFTPVLPTIFILIQEMLHDIGSNLVGSNSRRLSLSALVLTTILVSWTALMSLLNLRTERAELIAPVQYIEPGKWLAENAPQDATIALADAGAIPYYSGLKVIDYYGLVNSHIAHSEPKIYEVDTTDTSLGIKRRYPLRLDVEWLLDQQPDIIEIPGRVVDGRLLTHLEHASLIWSSERFHQEYPTMIYENNGIMFFSN